MMTAPSTVRSETIFESSRNETWVQFHMRRHWRKTGDDPGGIYSQPDLLEVNKHVPLTRNGVFRSTLNHKTKVVLDVKAGDGSVKLLQDDRVSDARSGIDLKTAESSHSVQSGQYRGAVPYGSQLSQGCDGSVCRNRRLGRNTDHELR